MSEERPIHEQNMRRAVELARRVPQVPFGALLASFPEGRVVAEGINRSDEGPLWHGEVDAIRNAPAGTDWPRLTLYTTAEPCPMCMAAALWAGVGRVVYGTSIPTLVRLGWRQIDLRAAEVLARAPFAACELVGGVLEEECDELFARAAKGRG